MLYLNIAQFFIGMLLVVVSSLEILAGIGYLTGAFLGSPLYVSGIHVVAGCSTLAFGIFIMVTNVKFKK